MELKEQILKALGLSSEVKFEVQAKLVDGTIIVSTADALAEGVDISVLTEDGTTIELPIGEYETEDGITFVVEEAGVIATVGEAEVVEEEEAPAEEEEVVEAAELSEFDSLEKRIANLEVVIAELKGDTEVQEEELAEETTEEEITEPSENPRTVTTKTTEVVEFSVEELKAENEKLKEELAKQPADTSLNTNKFSSEKRTLSKQDLRRMTSQEKYLYNLYNN
jgi:hypothetical protein